MLKFSDQKKGKIGLLVPQSKFIAQAGGSFLNGVQLAFTLLGDQINEDNCELIVEGIDDGSIANTKQKLEKLLLNDKVDVVAALIAYQVAVEVTYLFEDSNKILLLLNLGGHMMPDEVRKPYVFSHSLQSWQHNYLMGKWSAQHLGKRVLHFYSLYDAGFDNLAAFNFGFQQEGGEIVANQVTHVRTENHDFQQDFKNVNWDEFDWIMCHYVGDKTVEFIKAAKAANPTIQIGLSPLAIDRSIEQVAGDINFTVHGALIGIPGEPRPELEQFQQKCEQYFSGNGSPIELLGYESGQIIIALFERIFLERIPFDEQLGFMRTYEFDSPRGPIKMNTDRQITESELVVHEISLDKEGLSFRKVHSVEGIDEDNADLAYHKNLFKSSWLHPYGFG